MKLLPFIQRSTRILTNTGLCLCYGLLLFGPVLVSAQSTLHEQKLDLRDYMDYKLRGSFLSHEERDFGKVVAAYELANSIDQNRNIDLDNSDLIEKALQHRADSHNELWKKEIGQALDYGSSFVGGKVASKVMTVGSKAANDFLNRTPQYNIEDFLKQSRIELGVFKSRKFIYHKSGIQGEEYYADKQGTYLNTVQSQEMFNKILLMSQENPGFSRIVNELGILPNGIKLEMSKEDIIARDPSYGNLVDNQFIKDAVKKIRDKTLSKEEFKKEIEKLEENILSSLEEKYKEFDPLILKQDKEARDLQDFNSNMRIIQHSANIVSYFLPSQEAQELTGLADAVINFSQEFRALDLLVGSSAWGNNSASWAASLGSANAFIGVAMTLGKIFGSRKKKRQQESIRNILSRMFKQIDMLRTQMHSRFDRVDNQLANIYESMSESFSIVIDMLDESLTQMNFLNAITEQIHDDIRRTQSMMNEFSEEILININENDIITCIKTSNPEEVGIHLEPCMINIQENAINFSNADIFTISGSEMQSQNKLDIFSSLGSEYEINRLLYSFLDPRFKKTQDFPDLKTEVFNGEGKIYNYEIWSRYAVLFLELVNARLQDLKTVDKTQTLNLIDLLLQRGKAIRGQYIKLVYNEDHTAQTGILNSLLLNYNENSDRLIRTYEAQLSDFQSKVGKTTNSDFELFSLDAFEEYLPEIDVKIKSLSEKMPPSFPKSNYETLYRDHILGFHKAQVMKSIKSNSAIFEDLLLTRAKVFNANLPQTQQKDTIHPHITTLINPYTDFFYNKFGKTQLNIFNEFANIVEADKTNTNIKDIDKIWKYASYLDLGKLDQHYFVNGFDAFTSVYSQDTVKLSVFRQLYALLTIETYFSWNKNILDRNNVVNRPSNYFDIETNSSLIKRHTGGVGYPIFWNHQKEEDYMDWSKYYNSTLGALYSTCDGSELASKTPFQSLNLPLEISKECKRRIKTPYPHFKKLSDGLFDFTIELGQENTNIRAQLELSENTASEKAVEERKLAEYIVHNELARLQLEFYKQLLDHSTTSSKEIREMRDELYKTKQQIKGYLNFAMPHLFVKNVRIRALVQDMQDELQETTYIENTLIKSIEVLEKIRLLQKNYTAQNLTSTKTELSDLVTSFSTNDRSLEIKFVKCQGVEYFYPKLKFNLRALFKTSSRSVSSTFTQIIDTLVASPKPVHQFYIDIVLQNLEDLYSFVKLDYLSEDYFSGWAIDNHRDTNITLALVQGDVFPTDLFELPHVQEFTFQGSSVTNAEFENYNPNLRILNMASNKLTETIGINTQAMPKLKKLDLHRNNIGKLNMDWFTTTLDSLNLSQNLFDEVVIKAPQSSLRSIDISENQLQKFEIVDTLSNLSSVLLGQNELKGIVIDGGLVPKLEILSIENNHDLSNIKISNAPNINKASFDLVFKSLRSFAWTSSNLKNLDFLDSVHFPAVRKLDVSKNEIASSEIFDRSWRDLDSLTLVRIT